MPILEGFVETEPNIQLFFRTLGEGLAAVIPLACWTQEFDVLARNRLVIFYDPRSRGQSSAVELDEISFQNDVLDLERVRRHFGLEKVIPIGWSYFGGVVARYAMEFQEHVERLVMVCGPPIRRAPHSDVIHREMIDRVNAAAPGLLEEVQCADPPPPEKMDQLWRVMRQVRAGRPLKAIRG